MSAQQPVYDHHQRNFDDGSIEKQIMKMIARDKLRNSCFCGFTRRGHFHGKFRASMLEKAATVSVLSTANEDVRSLREMITYGLKGMAYAEHAKNIGKKIWQSTPSSMRHGATLDDSLSADDLCRADAENRRIRRQSYGASGEANTSRFGNPEITEVNIGVRKILRL